jgi:hypothetical protein
MANSENQFAVGEPLVTGQPPLADFKLYKCVECGKTVIGFEKDAHIQEKHAGELVAWKRMR